MQTTGPDEGLIRRLEPGETPGSGEVELSALEARLLRGVDLHDRVARLDEIRRLKIRRRPRRRRKRT